MKMRNVLIYLSMLYEGDWDKIYGAIKDKISIPENIDDQFVELKLNKEQCQAITIIDDNYPDYLKQSVKPPFVLYYKGNINLLNHYYCHVSVSGSRSPELETETLTTIISGLSNYMDAVVVSGLASGIDTVAHQACIDYGVSTIAILGSGINYCYPRSNWQLYCDILSNNGLILSEYFGTITPQPSNFPTRDRLIAAFSPKLIIGEAHPKSGTLITLEYALQHGSDIYVIPTAPKNCVRVVNNNLIKQGASLITQTEDLCIEQED